MNSSWSRGRHLSALWLGSFASRTMHSFRVLFKTSQFARTCRRNSNTKTSRQLDRPLRGASFVAPYILVQRHFLHCSLFREFLSPMTNLWHYMHIVTSAAPLRAASFLHAENIMSSSLHGSRMTSNWSCMLSKAFAVSCIELIDVSHLDPRDITFSRTASSLLAPQSGIPVLVGTVPMLEARSQESGRRDYDNRPNRHICERNEE